MRDRLMICLTLPAFLISTLLASMSWAEGEKGGFEEKVDELVMRIVRDVEGSPDQPFRIAVGNFTYAYTGFPTEFAYFLHNQLELSISREKGIELMARRELDELLKELEVSLSDLFDPDTCPQPGKLKGLEAILMGTYNIWGKEVKIFASLIKVEEGRKLSVQGIEIPLRAIPENVRVKLEKAGMVSQNYQHLSKPIAEPTKGLQIKMWVDKGDGGLYLEGDKMTIYLRVSRDCYVRIYNVQPDGRSTLIFPNRYCPEGRIKGGRVYRIPDKGYSFDLMITEPFGPEMLYAVASTEPFSDREAVRRAIKRSKGPFIRGFRSVEELRERVVAVVPSVGGSALAAQAISRFTTAPRD